MAFRGRKKPSLTALADKHRTDKGQHGHDYCRYYEPYLQPFAESEHFSMLEIGVSRGNSLRMWQEYFPKGKVYGVEVSDRFQRGPMVFRGSACDRSLVNTMPQFDLIVDDGSHLGKEQVVAFGLLWKHLNGGGLYAIEDLHASYHRRMGSAGRYMLFRLVDACNWNGKSNRMCYERFAPELKLSPMEREVEFVHFYPGIAFIKKREKD